MDVRLSTEQQDLRDAATRVVERTGPSSVRALDDRERSARLESAVSTSGWRELRTATGGGGPLASGVEAALVAEELGRRVADVPYLGPVLAAELRRRAGAPASPVAETVLLDPGLSSLSVAAGDDPGATPAGVAVDAAGALQALLLAPSSRGARPAVVALGPARTRPDLTRPSADPDPAAPVTVVGGASAVGGGDLAAWLALGVALTCADLVGAMRGAVGLACDHATNRRQYGAPIGSYQAVQHLLADAHVATEGSRSVALHAAWAVDALAPDEALSAASVAKAYCARAAREVCETVVQVHGGVGNTWDCLAHVYLRRVLLSGEILGGAGASLGRVLAARGIGADRGLR